MLNNLHFSLAELGLVGWNEAAAAKPDPGDATHGSLSREVCHRPIDVVHVLGYFLEQHHVPVHLRKMFRSNQPGQDREIERDGFLSRHKSAFQRSLKASGQKVQRPAYGCLTVRTQDVGWHGGMHGPTHAMPVE